MPTILRQLARSAPVPLPEGYLQQLGVSNGGEGDLGAEPGWIAFWAAEDVISFNNSYDIASLLPGFFGFGSDGGGELFAFDTRNGQPYPIVAVPFIPMDTSLAIPVSSSFAHLQKLIGQCTDETKD